MASSAVVTFAPALLRRAGVASDAAATALSGAVSGAKVLGVAAALLLVDAAGRRPLATWGGAACSLSPRPARRRGLAAPPEPRPPARGRLGLHHRLLGLPRGPLLGARLGALQHARQARGGHGSDGLALRLGRRRQRRFSADALGLGGGVTFSIFAAVAASVAVLCWLELPETKGRTLAEVVEVMQRRGGKAEWRAGARAAEEGQAATEREELLPPLLPLLLLLLTLVPRLLLLASKGWWPPRSSLFGTAEVLALRGRRALRRESLRERNCKGEEKRNETKKLSFF